MNNCCVAVFNQDRKTNELSNQGLAGNNSGCKPLDTALTLARWL